MFLLSVHLVWKGVNYLGIRALKTEFWPLPLYIFSEFSSSIPIDQTYLKHHSEIITVKDNFWFELRLTKNVLFGTIQRSVRNTNYKGWKWNTTTKLATFRFGNKRETSGERQFPTPSLYCHAKLKPDQNRPRAQRGKFFDFFNISDICSRPCQNQWAKLAFTLTAINNFS